MALLVLLPQVTFAAWWNPLSWFTTNKTVTNSDNIDQENVLIKNFISKNSAIDIEKDAPRYSIDIQKYIDQNRNIFLSANIKDIFKENGKIYVKVVPTPIVLDFDYVAILEVTPTDFDLIKTKKNNSVDIIVTLQNAKKPVAEIYSDVNVIDQNITETYLDPSTDMFILRGKIIDIK